MHELLFWSSLQEMNLYPNWYDSNGSNYDVCVYVTENVSTVLSTHLESYYLNFEQHFKGLRDS